MSEAPINYQSDPEIAAFLDGKPEYSLLLFHSFLQAFARLAPVQLEATQSMVSIRAGERKIAWITRPGKNFLHIVFPFGEPCPGNLCFQKIARVPGQQQYNHHLRILKPEDINEEVLAFMQKALR
jgi:hypothetical protein